MSRSKHTQASGAVQLLPRSTFDAQFLVHVLPDLRTAITLGAHMVHHELETFSAAVSRVNAMAHQRGSYRLSPETLDELMSWIDCALLEALMGPRSPDLITPSQLAKLTGEPRE